MKAASIPATEPDSALPEGVPPIIETAPEGGAHSASLDVQHTEADGDVQHSVSYLPDDPDDLRKLAPLERRCTAQAKDGRRCRSYVVKGTNLCGGHSGLGLAASPVEHAKLSAEKRRHLKLTRQLVAPGGKWGPRAALRMEAMRRADALAARAVDAALDPQASPVAAGNLALRLIEAVDPAEKATLEVSIPSSVEAVEQLGPAALLSLAAQLGISAGDPLPA